MELVPIVTESGEKIGEVERSVAHGQELLHSGVRILMKLPDGKFVFQKRGKLKELNPGRMTFAATGHVKAHQQPIEAAVEELFEETGIHVAPEELTFLGTYYHKHKDTTPGKKKHKVLGYFYGYSFPGKIEDLRVEEVDGDGFAAYSLAEIKAVPENEQGAFVDIVFVSEVQEMMKKYENQN